MNLHKMSKTKSNKIYHLLAAESLKAFDFVTAEKAFVNSKNLYGIRLIKKLKLEKNEKLKQAQINSYLGHYDQANQQFNEADRTDLVINMEYKLNTLTLSQVSKIYNTLSDDQVNQMYLKIAEKHMVDSEYSQVVKSLNSINKHNLNKHDEKIYYNLLISVFLKNGNYSGIFEIGKNLNEGHELLKVSIGSKLENLWFEKK